MSICLRGLKEVGMTDEEGAEITMNFFEHIAHDAAIIEDTSYKMAFWDIMRLVMDKYE